MATKKQVKKMEAVPEAKVVEVEPVVEAVPEAEPVDPVAAKVEQIKSLFAEIGGVEGIEVDTTNPDHQLILAFYVGQRNLIRR